MSGNNPVFFQGRAETNLAMGVLGRMLLQHLTGKRLVVCVCAIRQRPCAVTVNGYCHSKAAGQMPFYPELKTSGFNLMQLH